jgi:MFS family permease
VIFIGLENGMLMPTILDWIATITPKQFLRRASGGFSVFLNLVQFASSVAIVPLAAFALTDHSIFLAFGCAAFVLVLPYLFVTILEKYALAERSRTMTEA